MEKISKHICEVRYKPDAKILDKRGQIASSMTNSLFSSWQISNNRIDFKSDKDNNISAFLSFKNLGFVTNYPHNSKKFLEIGENFIKDSWNYFQGNNVVRVGIKSSFIVDINKDFTNLFKFYTKHLSLFIDKKTFSADLVDIGLSLNYANGDEYFNLTTGPMDKEQIQLFFGKDISLENGIFVEVDYFKKDFSPEIKQKDVLSILKNGTEKAENILDTIIEIAQK